MVISNLPKGYIELAHDGERARTKLALLIDFGDQEVWIPESQLYEMWDDTLIIPEWLAEEKGLI
jgi:hypothetical protein